MIYVQESRPHVASHHDSKCCLLRRRSCWKEHAPRFLGTSKECWNRFKTMNSGGVVSLNVLELSLDNARCQLVGNFSQGHAQRLHVSVRGVEIHRETK